MTNSNLVITKAPRGYDIAFRSIQQLDHSTTNHMFRMLVQNMKEAYEETIGWNEEEKYEEFTHKDGKFLIAVDSSNSQEILGFCYFRFEREGEADVIYCYELQVRVEYRHKHIGYELMKVSNTY